MQRRTKPIEKKCCLIIGNRYYNFKSRNEALIRVKEIERVLKIIDMIPQDSELIMTNIKNRAKKEG